MLRKRILGREINSLIIFFLISLFLCVLPASSLEYPTRPIKIIVPYAPGGVASVTWRSMAESMSKTLGKPVVIENKPGGGTSLAYSLIASSKPDGYTVGQVAFGALINTYLAYDVAYNPFKSFTYIGGVARYNEGVAVRSDAPWKTWNEFVDYSKLHPNEIRMGYTNPIGGNATPVKWAAQKMGLQWKHITFQSEAECITALLGKNIEAFPGAGVVHMLVKDGRARILLALTIDPIPDCPDAVTFKEVYGKDTMNGFGLIGPAGIPEPIAQKLENALHEGTKDPAFLIILEEMGAIPRWRTGKEFSDDVEKQLASSQLFLKDLGLIKGNK